MKAMIFAAGLGTRLQPLTNKKPKALIEVGGETLLERIIKKLQYYGISEIVINVHHLADHILAFLKAKNNFGTTIHISDERNLLLDTGGGLKKAAPLLAGNEPILIHNVDVLSDTNLNELVDFHLREEALATLLVRNRNTERYLLLDQNHRLTGWENIRTGERKWVNPGKAGKTRSLAFGGIHVIHPIFLNRIRPTGRFSIIDTYLEQARDGKIVGFEDNQGRWMDIGKPEQLEKARRLFGKIAD
jgi:NDP-sugar pyrophosphorylase family protein